MPKIPDCSNRTENFCMFVLGLFSMTYVRIAAPSSSVKTCLCGVEAPQLLKAPLIFTLFKHLYCTLCIYLNVRESTYLLWRWVLRNIVSYSTFV